MRFTGIRHTEIRGFWNPWNRGPIADPPTSATTEQPFTSSCALDRIHRIDRTHIVGSIDPVTPVYIYKVEQIHAVDGIADGGSHQPRSALGVTNFSDSDMVLGISVNGGVKTGHVVAQKCAG